MFHPNYIEPNKLITNSCIAQLFQMVERHGGILRFVGGAVRDAIMGFPHADIDLVTDMSPSEFSEMCNDEEVRCVPIGIQFFSLGVIIHDHFFKVTCLSSDNDSSQDEWKRDASCRDLTINAVYADDKGNVFDYYNGIEDLKTGSIKFIGKPLKAIQADPLRIMRFFRFCAMYGKKIDKKSLKCCIENKILLHSVSLEKIKEELFKIIVAPYSVRALELIFKYGVLDFILSAPKGFEKLEKLDKLVNLLKIEKDIIRRIYVLFEPTAKRASRLAAIFKLNKEQKEHLCKLCLAHVSAKDFKDIVSIRKVIYRYGRNICVDLFLLLNIDNEDTYSVSSTLNTLLSIKINDFPLKGSDLIKLGVSKEHIGLHLEILKNIWFENGCLLSKDEILQKYSKNFKYNV